MTTRLCPVKGCSRPLKHRGKHGRITAAELKAAVPGSNGSRADIDLWHAVNHAS